MTIAYPGRPSRQMYTGLPMTEDVVNVTQAVRGQLSPYPEETMNLWHGRELAGLGGIDVGGAPGTDEVNWGDVVPGALEAEDDVSGSGIFDSAGTATVHTNMGVFQDHPSIPGYIARNPPYTVNREVSAIDSGAEVVEVAGGGLNYVERDGRLFGPSGGPAPPPVPRAIPGSTGPDEPYIVLGPPNPSRWTPPTVPPDWRMRAAPMNPASARVDWRSIWDPAMAEVQVGTGMGQDAPASTPSGWGSYLFAGLLVGGAAALFVGAVRGKGR
jgi:hypothetical protein